MEAIDGIVTIPLQKYLELTKAAAFLQALEECGVDNWHGYHDAYVMAHASEEEE